MIIFLQTQKPTTIMRPHATAARPRSVRVAASQRGKQASDAPPRVDYGRGWFDATRRAGETTTGKGARAELGACAAPVETK